MKLWPFSRASKVAPQKAPTSPRRGYEAAGSKLTFADFRGSKGSADYELIGGIAAVREKTRALARNSGTMRRFIRLLQTNVVGPNGFQYRCRVRRPSNDELDRVLNKSVEVAFWKWSKRPTVDGQMTLRQVNNLLMASWARDGEAFVEIVSNPMYLDGFALNVLEADMIDETLNTVYSPTGNQIRMGVEIDRYNRPVAYHVFTQHPGDPGWYFTKGSVREKYRRVPAEKIIHIYEVLRAGQTRGEPPASATVRGVKMLDGYREAEVTGRRIASSVMGWFKRALPQASQIDAMADRVSDTDESAFEVDLQPGTFKTLPDGYEFDKFEASGSTVDYSQFESQVKKDIAMGLNVSNMSLGMETQAVSYSTGRSVLQEDRDYYRFLQSFLIERFLDVIIERWVLSHSLSENSVIPPSKVALVLTYSSFAGRGWDWVDPSKDVAANAEALRTRQTTLSRIAAQRGVDFLDMVEEMANDEKILKEAGLTVTFGDATASNVDTPSEDAEGDGTSNKVE